METTSIHLGSQNSALSRIKIYHQCLKCSNQLKTKGKEAITSLAEQKQQQKTPN